MNRIRLRSLEHNCGKVIVVWSIIVREAKVDADEIWTELIVVWDKLIWIYVLLDEGVKIFEDSIDEQLFIVVTVRMIAVLFV